MNIRTDLAMEAREALGGDTPRGVTQQIFQRNGFCLTRVEIQTKEVAEILGKPVGTYTTIEHASLCNADDAQRDVCAQLFHLCHVRFLQNCCSQYTPFSRTCQARPGETGNMWKFAKIHLTDLKIIYKISMKYISNSLQREMKNLKSR